MNTTCRQALLQTSTNGLCILYGIFLDQNKVRKSKCLKLGSKGEKYAVFVLGYPNYAPRKKFRAKCNSGWLLYGEDLEVEGWSDLGGDDHDGCL